MVPPGLDSVTVSVVNNVIPSELSMEDIVDRMGLVVLVVSSLTAVLASVLVFNDAVLSKTLGVLS